MTSSRVCIDANLVVRVIVEPENEPVQRQWEAWHSDAVTLVAPSLLTFEVTNALYRYRRAGQMTVEWVRAGLTAALALPIEIYTFQAVHLRAVELAEQLGLGAAYDAHYLALAQQLGVPLWTADRRLYRAAKDVFPWVHLVGE